LVALKHDKSGSDIKLALDALKKRVAAIREDFESFLSKVSNAPMLKGYEI
jgi:hypothetical protein